MHPHAPARRIFVAVVCATAGLAAMGGTAHAATCDATWTGAQSNQWGDTGNWSPQTIPGPYGNNPNVCLPANGAHYPVDLSPYGYSVPNVGTENTNTASIGSLTISPGAGLVVHGASTVIRGDGYQTTTLSVNGASSVAAGGSLELLASDDGVNPTPENGHGGNAVLSGPGTITNSGTFSSVSTTTQATASSNAFHNQLEANLVDAPGSSGAVTSGFLDLNGGVTVTNQSTWTVAGGAEVSVVHNGLQTGPTTLANQGTYVNAGTTAIGNEGQNNEQDDVFAQSGPETGNPVILDRQGELSDAAGAGSFEFDDQSGQLAGTVPAGQTVTIRGDLYGDDAYQDTVGLVGAQVVNQGTLALDSPNVSQDTNTGVVVNGSPLVNQGTIVSTSEAPHLDNELDVTLANQHGAVVDVGAGQLATQGGQTWTNDGTISVAPGATLDEYANPFLTGPETFTNAADGTLAPQIASPTSYGTIEAGADSTFNVAGTMAPQLLGGYVPAIGTSFAVLPSDPRVKALAGSFGAVGAGFAADYANESAMPGGVSVVYGGLPASGAGGGTPSGGGSTTHPHPTLHVARPKVKDGTLRLTLSCPAHTSCSRATITATVTETLRGGRLVGLTAPRAVRHAKVRHRTVVVGVVHALVRAGHHATVTLKLNRRGRALLERFGRLRLGVTVSAGHAVHHRFRVMVRRPRPHHPAHHTHTSHPHH